VARHKPLPKGEVEPEAVFSQEEREEIARSVHLAQLPPEMAREICDALFAYHVDCLSDSDQEDATARKDTGRKRRRAAQEVLERHALEEVVHKARAFRHALHRLQHFLKHRDQIDEAEELADRAYKVQSYARLRLEFKGGRPSLTSLDDLVARLVRTYERFTGRRPGRSENPKTGQPSGPLVRFISIIFRINKIPLSGLKHRIAKAALEAKNPP